MEPSTRTLHCIVVTPEKAVLDQVVDFVALPMYDGELGVLPGRAALIGRLGPGELRVRRGNETQRYYVDGGFAQVRANVVTVLTPRAVPEKDLDANAARRALDAALKPGATAEAPEAQYKNQQRARAQLRLAGQRPAATHA
jgi:F-type H+-transporting ATPase subunit epsilon